MSQPAGPPRVTALRRPPVRQSTTVRSDLWHTFDTLPPARLTSCPPDPARLPDRSAR